MNELVEKLRRNSRFYENEAKFLGERLDRRDNRYLGTKEAQTIADLLREAADDIERLEQAYEASDG